MSVYTTIAFPLNLNLGNKEIGRILIESNIWELPTRKLFKKKVAVRKFVILKRYIEVDEYRKVGIDPNEIPDKLQKITSKVNDFIEIGWLKDELYNEIKVNALKNSLDMNNWCPAEFGLCTSAIGDWGSDDIFECQGVFLTIGGYGSPIGDHKDALSIIMGSLKIKYLVEMVGGKMEGSHLNNINNSVIIGDKIDAICNLDC